MTVDFDNVLRAWKQAAEDLKIEILIPFFLKTEGKEEIKFELLVKDFGSKLGTLVSSIGDTTSHFAASDNGFYFSALNPLAYSSYNRNYFIETLTDWGYFGNVNNMPEWYTGHVYQEHQ